MDKHKYEGLNSGENTVNRFEELARISEQDFRGLVIEWSYDHDVQCQDMRYLVKM